MATTHERIIRILFSILLIPAAAIAETSETGYALAWCLLRLEDLPDLVTHFIRRRMSPRLLSIIANAVRSRWFRIPCRRCMSRARGGLPFRAR